MRNPVSVDEMRSIEEKGQTLGISKLMMMENAGSSIATYLHNSLPKPRTNNLQRILVIGGTGNNGGDVFVAARHLAYWPFYSVSVILIGNENDIQAEEAKINWNIVSQVPKINKFIVDRNEKLDLLEKEISRARALIIGIFGTGFRGKPRDLQLQAIMLINNAKSVLKISADIPSGMEADSGISDYSVASDVTLTMYAPKKGMLSPEARKKTGEIIEVNIGLPI